MRKFLLTSCFFCFLTILTQIGGIVFLIAFTISKILTKKVKFQTSLIFLSLYFASTFFVIPLLAPIFGRQKIETTENLKPANIITVFLNRNYVTPELNHVLQEISTNRSVRFLDANFPFIDGFPLLPHLSHDDGKKVDLSFVYKTSEGMETDKVKSISGYGVFEAPVKGEFHQTEECKSRGYFQYDYSKYLTFGTRNSDLLFSKQGTRNLILNVLNQDEIEKIFIEPHLATRMNLNYSKIRFHGCQAVRHDDHIHIQL